MKKTLWAFLLIATLVPSATYALGECKSDRDKFCPTAGFDQDKIKACLKANYKDLSPACKQMIDQKIEEKVEQKLNSQSN